MIADAQTRPLSLFYPSASAVRWTRPAVSPLPQPCGGLVRSKSIASAMRWGPPPSPQRWASPPSALFELSTRSKCPLMVVWLPAAGSTRRSPTYGAQKDDGGLLAATLRRWTSLRRRHLQPWPYPFDGYSSRP